MVDLPQGYQLQLFENLDSTNEEARRQVAAGDAKRGWIMAKSQTSGRGRQGREWTSTYGNLFCSLLLDVNAPPKKAAQLSFVAALSVGECLRAFIDDQALLSFKWPNDVLLSGRKISGILLESAGQSEGQVTWLIIGIGVNLTSYPEGVAFPATALCETQEQCPLAGDVLEKLAYTFDDYYMKWQSKGFAPIREEWLNQASHLGEEVTVRLPQEILRGRFDTLDEDGALILFDSAGSRRAIAAGDVYFDSGIDQVN